MTPNKPAAEASQAKLRPSAATGAPGKTEAFAITRHILFGAGVMGLLALAIGGWAASAKLTSAIIAPGSLVVDRHVKKVQHRDGGIVAEIAVKNGDLVEAGQVILKLDKTQIKAELGIIQAQLIELTARSARLAAEGDGLVSIKFQPVLFEMGEDAKRIADGERRLFALNRTNMESQREQLRLQVEQLKQEIIGIEAQRSSTRGQLELIAKELKEVRQLYQRKLTPVTRVYTMEREVKRLDGEHGRLIAQIARAKGKISEIELQILSIDQTARTQAQRELRTIEARLAELKERHVAAWDRLSRCDIRAPQSGIVHEMAVHTVGGVIVPAEPILLVVPRNDKLTIEARFAPVDIDQIVVGRHARLRFSAFDQKTTPELDGRVVSVSADVTNDPKSGQNYFLGRIEIDEGARDRLEGLKLVPGMPVEAFVATGTRTALSYLIKPITDQFQRAFREN